LHEGTREDYPTQDMRKHLGLICSIL